MVALVFSLSVLLEFVPINDGLLLVSHKLEVEWDNFCVSILCVNLEIKFMDVSACEVGGVPACFCHLVGPVQAEAVSW